MICRCASQRRGPERALCEPEQRPNFKTLQFFSHAFCLAKLLRVADPRSARHASAVKVAPAKSWRSSTRRVASPPCGPGADFPPKFIAVF